MDKEKIRRQILLHLTCAWSHRLFMNHYYAMGNAELAGNARKYYADNVRLAHNLGRQLRSM